MKSYNIPIINSLNKNSKHIYIYIYVYIYIPYNPIIFLHFSLTFSHAKVYLGLLRRLGCAGAAHQSLGPDTLACKIMIEIMDMSTVISWKIKVHRKITSKKACLLFHQELFHMLFYFRY